LTVSSVKEKEIKEFIRKKVSGFDQCFRCGACSGICPVKKINPIFDPRKIIHQFLLGLHERILNEVLWYCAQCGSCVAVCPMDVKPKEVIKALRDYLIENKLIDLDRLFEIGAFAKVNPEKCVVCLTCVRVCPFFAISIKEDVSIKKEGFAGFAEIDPSKCRACGICVMECPARAIELKAKREYIEVRN